MIAELRQQFSRERKGELYLYIYYTPALHSRRLALPLQNGKRRLFSIVRCNSTPLFQVLWKTRVSHSSQWSLLSSAVMWQMPRAFPFFARRMAAVTSSLVGRSQLAVSSTALDNVAGSFRDMVWWVAACRGWRQSTPSTAPPSESFLYESGRSCNLLGNVWHF